MNQITFGKPVPNLSQHVTATSAAGQRMGIPTGINRIQLYCDVDVYVTASSDSAVQASTSTNMRLPGGVIYTLDLGEAERFLSYICAAGVSGQFDMTPLA